MRKLKEAEDPFRQVFLTDDDTILKVQEQSDDPILKYAAKHPNQFARCLQSWTKDGLHYYVYEKLDFVLEKMKLTKKQLYSMLCQVALILRELRKNGWAWLDLHDGNLGAVKCNGNVVIDGVSIPSHGYRFKVLDFGDFIHKSNKDKQKHEDYIMFSNVKWCGGHLWYLLVPSVYAEESKTELQNIKVLNIDLYFAKTAVYRALRGRKTNVPVDDILFFGMHGLLSDESVAYMKKKI
jgi:hypothetical protein